jgi:alpha-galactosidase/6-phospho-beta-glucosidase family protein
MIKMAAIEIIKAVYYNNPWAIVVNCPNNCIVFYYSSVIILMTKRK